MKRHIPNFITSMNILCGVVGVIFAFKGRFDVAFPLMIAAAAFDFCDGLAARMLGAYSDFGKELDSLCDVVSFGVLPAVMLYRLMQICSFGENWCCFVPVVITVAAALRLAKFNIDDLQHSSFLGLPVPVQAMVSGSLCYFVAYEPSNFLSTWSAGNLFIPLLSVVLSALMVSRIPMFSMKFGKGTESGGSDKGKRLAFAVNVLIIIAIVASFGLNWSLVVLFSFVVYVLMNVVFAITLKK